MASVRCTCGRLALRLALGCAVLAVAAATYPAAKPKRYGDTKPKFMPSQHGKPPACLTDPRLTYCIDPDDYPKERIVYLLKNNMFDVSSILMDETRNTYTFETMDAPKPMYNYQPPPQQGYLPPVAYNTSKSPITARGRRFRRQAPPQDDSDDLCPSSASYIMPRAAQSMGGDWMYLVNLGDSPQFTQLVRSETCIRNQCTGSCQAPPGSVAVCQQQFVQKRLVALDGSGSTLNQDIFWFPSCCQCKIRTQ